MKDAYRRVRTVMQKEVAGCFPAMVFVELLYRNPGLVPGIQETAPYLD
jgi:hypothetical protein